MSLEKSEGLPGIPCHCTMVFEDIGTPRGAKPIANVGKLDLVVTVDNPVLPALVTRRNDRNGSGDFLRCAFYNVRASNEQLLQTRLSASICRLRSPRHRISSTYFCGQLIPAVLLASVE